MHSDDCQISINLHELVKKESDGTLTNEDFTRIWTDVVSLPIYRFEYVIRTSKHTAVGYDKNQAVFYGLLVHIFKTLCNMRRIVCKRVIDVYVANFHIRTLVESCTRLLYFLDHPEEVDIFRKNSIKPELKFKKIILDNMNSRDKDFYCGESEYEENLLKSIQESLDSAEYDGNEAIPKLHNMYEMMQDQDLTIMYTPYASSSHFVHCDWSAIFKYYLDENGGKYYPCFDDYEVDIRLLNPILLLCYHTLRIFLLKYPGHCVEQSLLDDIKFDKNIIVMLERMHHNYLHKMPLETDIEQFIEL